MARIKRYTNGQWEDVIFVPEVTNVVKTTSQELTDGEKEQVRENINAAPENHTHTKSQITDFPTSMPASDVPAWAKAETKPIYTASEVGAVTEARVQEMINAIAIYDGSVT